MDRRSFLRGAIALSAVAVAPPSLAFDNAPIVYGDGVHDDWAGLQAMFDGKPFRVDNEVVVAGDGVVSGGDFVLSRTLTISGDNILVTDSRFTARDWQGDQHMLRLENCHGAILANLRIDCTEMHAREATIFSFAA